MVECGWLDSNFLHSGPSKVSKLFLSFSLVILFINRYYWRFYHKKISKSRFNSLWCLWWFERLIFPLIIHVDNFCRLAVSLFRSNLDAESPEIRAMLSAFRSSNKDVVKALGQLRQELEAKHQKEMVGLRTYFERIMEKQWVSLVKNSGSHDTCILFALYTISSIP